jgi:biopolymer transport protein ExbB/TolQ
MNILAGLETFLYVVSSVLFFPVVAGLVILTFWIIISFGGFLREYLERKRGNSLAFNRYKERFKSEILSCRTDIVDIKAEKFLQEAELNLIKSLDRVRFAIRVGPALGLMGTLIPMGIALSSLAQGNMPKMAGSMVTAFTTTVVGLACGVASYLMALVKEKWVRIDMREMEYLTEISTRNLKSNGKELQSEVKDEILEETEKV